MNTRASFQHTTPRLRAVSEPEPASPLLMEPSLFYDPPYERPLEDEFAWHLVKYLQPITSLLYQTRVETPCANIWVDFIVEQGGRRLGFEVGSADEEADEEALRHRDALIIGSGAVDVLYRFRYADLLYRIHDGLYLASHWDPELFSARGRINLNTLTSPEARACRPRPHHAIATVAYPPEALPDEAVETYEGGAFDWMDAHPLPPELIVRRLSRANPGAWIEAYDSALAHYGVSDARLGKQWAKSA